MSPETERPLDRLVLGLWRENPVFVAVLGLCPSMAVTNSLTNGLVMGAATTFVLIGSSLLVSLLRHWIPRAVRVPCYILVIATFVTTVDFTLAALLPAAHKQLGAFIALIVVNCIILGRQEAYASRKPVPLALADAVGMSLGFTAALTMIGAVREVLGSGSLLGLRLFGERFEPWAIMILPPGGFLTLGCILLAKSWWHARRERAKAPAGAAAPSPGGGGAGGTAGAPAAGASRAAPKEAA
jgi:electron transport complex protein RnfE